MAFELLSLLFLFVAGVGESNAYITFDTFFEGVGRMQASVLALQKWFE